MARPERVHYLRSNDSERSPHRLLLIDTETDHHILGDLEVHELRVWCARHRYRHGRQGRRPQTEEWQGQEGGVLADLVDAAGRRPGVLWLLTHNLSFDLTVTRLPVELARRGWELRKHNLASDAPWAHMKRGSSSLRLADTGSWLPRELGELGALLGMAKTALPGSGDELELWFRRCWRDVDIMDAAICGLMDEWDRRRLGSWSITGPATGWNSMLHMAPRAQRRGRRPAPGDDEVATPPQGPRVPVIDPDPVARAFERESIFSGRRDLWRWGRLPQVDYLEVDFRLAHLTVCAHHELPDRRAACFEAIDLDDWRISAHGRSVIARCRLRVESPRYPLRWRGAVLHPVGEFWTVLCGPEIADARERGELLEIGAGRSYRMGRHMQPWAQWALGELGRPEGEIDPMLWVALRGWARSVPGRWGMQVGRELLSGPSHVDGWSIERASFGRPPRRGAIFHLAGRWHEIVRDQEPDDSFPAVLAHIQSWDRLYLQRAIDVLGEDVVVQCNTDSAIVMGLRVRELAWEAGYEPQGDDATPAELEAGCGRLSRSTAPLVMRPKGWDRRLQLISPQHVRHGRRRKLAGIPAGAEEVEPGVFEFWTWPRLAGQLERGIEGSYVRERRKVSLNGVPISRWVYVDGCAEPVRAAVDGSGQTVLLGPGMIGCRRHGAALRDPQHPLLRRLL